MININLGNNKSIKISYFGLVCIATTITSVAASIATIVSSKKKN